MPKQSPTFKELFESSATKKASPSHQKSLHQKPHSSPVLQTTQIIAQYDHPQENTSIITGSSRLFYAKLSIAQLKVKKWCKKIKNMPPSLDLHGYTLIEYVNVFEQFIQNNEHQKVLHIIHGKGQINQPPKIKNHLNGYLKNHPKVIAFCSCPNHFGGTGALFVWLKNS